MPDTPVLAYLTSFYPRATDTFIRNEVRALREMGYTVHTFSVRSPPLSMAVSDDISEERSRTTYLLLSVPRLLLAGLAALLCFPLRMWAGARLAYRSGGTGIKARIWQTAYLLEAAVLARRLLKLNVRHLHNHIGENSAAVAMVASRLSGIPWSLTIHGPGEFDRPLAIALGEKIRSAAFVVAISEFGRSQLYRWCGQECWKRIHVVHCGVDGQFLAASPRPVPTARRLISVGRLCEQKGQLLLVEAAARLKRSGLNFELVLAGDGEMRPQIERAIHESGVEDTVKITGWINSEQVRQKILQSRALVLPSFAEGLPVVIMEALALGRPVISTYIAGIPELVEPNVSGWLVPAGALDELVAAMRDALTADPTRLDAMGRAGAQRVATNHDLKVETGKLASLLQASMNGQAWQ